MTNVIQFPVKEKEPVLMSQAGRSEPGKYEIGFGMGDRVEMWTPSFFGIQFLVWGSGKPEGPPEIPPPTGGTPASNRVANYDNVMAYRKAA